MTDENRPNESQWTEPAEPRAEAIVVTPEARTAARGAAYRPWRRSRTYVVFGFGTAAATFLLFSFFPTAIVTGWIALGCGIPAVVLARKEAQEYPESGDHGFIRWGRRLGWWGVIGGPLSGIAWILLVVALGVGFGL